MIPSRRPAVSLVVLAALLAGCGGGGAQAVDAAPDTAPPAVASAVVDTATSTDSATMVDSGCLPYAPHAVTITGVLEWRTYPGPPGYGETPDDDKPQSAFYVVPDEPVCTVGDGEYNDARRDVRLVQLVLSGEASAIARPLRGKRVAAEGTLFVAVWGHHYAPILLTVSHIEPAGIPPGLRVAVR